MRATLRQLEGAYAVVVMHKREQSRLVGARKDVPLVVGLHGEESFIASDVAAILAHTNRIIFLEEGDVADVRPTSVEITGVDGVPRHRNETLVDWSPEAAEKGGFDHFMLKEIHEQPDALRQSLAGRVTADGHVHAPRSRGSRRRSGPRPASRSSPAAPRRMPGSWAPRRSRTGPGCRPA